MGGLTNSGYYWFSSSDIDHSHHNDNDNLVRHMSLQPQPNGNSTLKVYGNILTREVTVSTTWADYVFEDNYNLMTLEEVYSFIKKNKHLPGIPSGSEIEAVGSNLVQMQSMQMAKIEELTLYLIQLEKRIKELEFQLKADN